MKKFIAIFEASYPGIEATQYSCFTWEQKNAEVDQDYVSDLIKNTTANHFFKAFVKKGTNISIDNINVSIDKIEPFQY